MCTALISIDPASDWPVLLMATRDEFVDRPWGRPAQWWPRYPGVLGGKDHQAGGTWFAVNAASSSVAMVLNGRSADHVGTAATATTRGVLPLAAAGTLELPTLADVRGMDPFHLLLVTSSGARLASWARGEYRVRDVPAGCSLVTSRGINQVTEPLVANWLGLLRASVRPEPDLAQSAEVCWKSWLSLLDEDVAGGPVDRATLLKRPTSEMSRAWATVSLAAFAAGIDGVRYDFATVPEDRPIENLRWSRIV